MGEGIVYVKMTRNEASITRSILEKEWDNLNMEIPVCKSNTMKGIMEARKENVKQSHISIDKALRR